MTDETLIIGFRSRCLTICSNSPEVLRPVERCFRHLLAQSPVNAVWTIEARRQGGQFVLRGVSDAAGPVLLDEAVRCIKFDAGLQLIYANPELIWFHAGAAVHQGSAVMILGNWGCGKSTLVTELYGRGWQFLADDTLPVEPATSKALAFPKCPAVRRNPGVQLSAEAVTELDKVEIEIDPARICPGAVPIGALIFPEFKHGAAPELTHCAMGDAAVRTLGATMNLKEHGAEATLRFVAALVQTTPVFRLTYGDGERAAEFIAEKHGNWRHS